MVCANPPSQSYSPEPPARTGGTRLPLCSAHRYCGTCHSGPEVIFRGHSLSEEWIDSFWKRVKKGAGCWLWMAGTSTGGYGNVPYYDALSGKVFAFAVHRVSWVLARG